MSEAFESKDPLILDDLIPGCVVWIPEYGYTEDAVFGLRATRRPEGFPHHHAAVRSSGLPYRHGDLQRQDRHALHEGA